MTVHPGENVWKSLGGELSEHPTMLFPNDVALKGC